MLRALLYCGRAPGFLTLEAGAGLNDEARD
jgi:hypothetical protein